MPQVFAEELKSIPMSPNLGESLERGHRFAREQMHRFVMLEHLLLALTEDPEAALILQSANVDLGRLGTDVSGYLGRLLEDMRSDGSAEPRPDPELLRVLQAAASAAQQSKRRQIDGAIVLAAIVGDGKSPAAGLLKAHGMTFEEAIRALQRANTKARLKPIPKAGNGAAPASASPPEPELPAPPRDAEPPPSAASVVRDALTEPAAASTDSVDPEGASHAAPQVQSADDILAAARARIQRRAAVLNQSPDSSPFQPQASGRAPSPDAPNADGMSSAMRELLAVSGGPSQPEPPVAPSPPQARGGAPQQTAEVYPFPSSEVRAPEPPPAFNGQRPPAPAPAVAPVRAQRAPRPAGPDRGPQPLPPWPGPVPAPAAPGPAVGHGPPPPDPRRLTRASAPLPPYPQAPRKGAAGAGGPLVESIPRRMQVMATSAGEVRIARDKLDSLVTALSARAAHPPAGPIVARALSVRLRSPTDGFYIETLSPETQWLDAGQHQQPADEGLVWRWNITPKTSGKAKLTLLVSMRSLGLDGSGEDAGPPDRSIEVKVRGRSLRKLTRGLVLLALLGCAAALGRVGGELGPMLVRSIRYVVGV